MQENMESIFEEIRRSLDEADAAREEMLSLGREVVRLSGRAITKMIAGEVERAEEEMSRMREASSELLRKIEGHQELLRSAAMDGFLAEYVEAEALYHVLKERRIPSPRELGVGPVPYVLGLADLIGELRRLVLEEVKRGNMDASWMLLRVMEYIFSLISTLDYPDAILPGLRHKVDVDRRLIDETKFFLVDMESRRRLEKALKEAVVRAEERSATEL
ncbi:MAG: hypothetical protein QW039_02935 [Fervidicoccaceae archaeon]